MARALISVFLLIGLAGPARAADARLAANCDTPRNAVYSLLYYLQDDKHNNPGLAAMCIDRDGLKHPAAEAPRAAIRLKKVLDARGLYVILDDLPAAEDYTNGKKRAAYELFPAELGDMIWSRAEDGRWMLSPAARDRIDKLYSETFPVDLQDVVDALPPALRYRVLGIQAWQLMGLLLLIILAMAARRLLIYISGRYVRKMAQNLQTKWVDAAIDTADNPIAVLVVALVMYAGFPILQFPVGLNKVAMLSARVLAAFSVVWLCYRMVDILAGIMGERAADTETKLDDQLVPLVRKTLKLFFAIIGVIFILQNLSVDVGSLLAGLGIGGLAFALAAKDTVANFFGSLMIFIDKPFQIGDWIIVSGVEGSVEEVGFRTTRIRTFYNSLITMPNSLITNSAIDNMGMRSYRRYKTSLGIHYDTLPNKVQAFCDGVRAVIQSTDGMRKDSYMVEFHSLGQSELNILVYCFMDVPDWQAELTTRTNLNLGILRLAKDLGVDFAYPTQSLHIDSTPTASRPLSEVPDDVETLKRIVATHALGGDRALPRGARITMGYHPGKLPGPGSHTESDEDAGQS